MSYNDLSITQLEKLVDSSEFDYDLMIQKLNHLKDEMTNEEIAIKTLINSLYGATANKYFSLFDINISESITLQGQDAIKYAEKIVNEYFYNIWHTREKLHADLGITNVKPVVKPIGIYMDTDSSGSDTIIITPDEKITIEEYWNKFNSLIGHEKDDRGNEIVHLSKNSVSEKLLNWTQKEKVVFSDVKKIIRHKVTKAKWKLKTKSGKEVIITNDHSLVVFREGEQLTIKAHQVNIKTDKILSIKDNSVSI